MNRFILRHGDLVFSLVEAIPTNAKKIMSGKLNKLALGETTGHSHKLVTDVEVDVYELDGVQYFTLPQDATLSHEEHETIRTITDKPVIYKQWVKNEFDYFSGELRAVRD